MHRSGVAWDRHGRERPAIGEGLLAAPLVDDDFLIRREPAEQSIPLVAVNVQINVG